jgi:hypothetical protein
MPRINFRFLFAFLALVCLGAQIENLKAEPGADTPATESTEEESQTTTTQDGTRVEFVPVEPPEEEVVEEEKLELEAELSNEPAVQYKGPFLEGDLASIGATGLIPWENRFGFVIGIERIGEIFYASVSPEFNITREAWGFPFSLSLGLPVRTQLLDSRADRGWDDLGRLRKKDWDEISDYARILRFLKLGGKEKPFYLNVDSFTPGTLGHGTILKRYNPSLNLNTRRVSAQFDAFSDYIGMESYVNDITGPNILGALVFVKPLSFLNRKSFVLRSFSIGFTWVADLDAPLRNQLDDFDVDNDGRRFNEIEVDQNTFQPVYTPSKVYAYGVDVEFKVMDRRSLDWKVYLDYSALETGVPTDPAGSTATSNIPTVATRATGFTWGSLFRSNLGNNPVHALRFRVEFRQYDPNYLPSYFDSLYEVQRVQYFNTQAKASSELANQTKLQKVLGRETKDDSIQGIYLEGTWRLGNSLALSLGLELNSQTADDSLYVHFELPRLGDWQFFASYQRRSAAGFGELFHAGFRDTDLFMLKTRYRLFAFLHFNLEAMTPFGIGPESLFRNTLSVNANVELGFDY